MIITLNKKVHWTTITKSISFAQKVQITFNPAAYVDPNPSVVKISFTDCNFHAGLEIDLNIEASQFTSISLSFINCLIPNSGITNFIRQNDTQKVDLFFHGCILKDLDFESSKFTSISFSRTVIPEGRFVCNTSAITYIDFSNCLGNYVVNDQGIAKVNINYTESNLYVEPLHKINSTYKEIARNLNLQNILLMKTRFLLTDTKEIYVRFSDKSDKVGLVREKQFRPKTTLKREFKYNLTRQEIENLDISINIDQRKSVTKKVQISKALLSSLSLTGESESSIIIEHLSCQRIYIDKLKAKELQFYDIKSRQYQDSKCSIINSLMGSSQFNKVYFNSFSIVNFYRSYFEEARFSGTQFPIKIETIENIHFPDLKEDNYAEMQYELFRQMKVALVKNYNQIQALDMHQRMFNAIGESKNMSKEDRIILIANRISNNHETSISNPFWLSLSLLIFFWLLYCFFLPDRPFVIGWYGCLEFERGIIAYFRLAIENFKVMIVLANPVHSMSNLSDLLPAPKTIPLTTGNYVVSFFSRLFIAWTYYQFVSSFRKFGKKL